MQAYRASQELKALTGRALRDLLGVERPGEARSRKIVAHRHGCIFIGVPKVATTSLVAHFAALGLLEDGALESAPLESVLARHPRARGYPRFGFVRNPWDRLLSCYLDKIAGGGRDPDFKLATYKGLNPRMSFAEFVRWVADSRDGQDARADRHWMSQHRFFEAGDRRAPEIVGRFENLPDDLAHIAACLELPDRPLRVHRNAAPGAARGPRGYRAFYDSETRDLVARRYARDIALYGYRF